MKKILIADDCERTRTFLKVVLENQNYSIVESEDGKEALKTTKREKPDLIITDVMMPKLNGWEFTKLIKKDEYTKDIPVIMLTAKGEHTDQIMGYESGIDAYLVKPIKPMEIVEEVNRILD